MRAALLSAASVIAESVEPPDRGGRTERNPLLSQPGPGLDHAALSELAGMLVSTETFDALTTHVAELSARAVPAALTCGITLSQSGNVMTVASADALARSLDEQQYEMHDGPCLQAMRTGHIVSVEDFGAETRWHGYPARAMGHGVSCAYSSPLVAGEHVHGALNMYAASPRAFDDHARTTIAAFTALASAIITAALRRYDEVTLTDHLRSALSSRAVIDQAMGIVIAAQRCGPTEAFDVLRKISQSRNTPLRDVAAELVARTASETG